VISTAERFSPIKALSDRKEVACLFHDLPLIGSELSEQVTLALGWHRSRSTISGDFRVGKHAYIEEATFDLPT
jgi:hypothetical protein